MMPPIPEDSPMLCRAPRRKDEIPSSSSSGPQPEGLSDVVSDMFLSNKLSARDIARLARGGKHSEAKGVDSLAAAGASGRHPQNMARDIMRALLKKTKMPECTWFEVPCWDPATKDKTKYFLPFLLPHLVADQLFAGRSDWRMNPAKAPEIWNSFVQTCQTLNLDPDKCMPIGMHGDGVPFTKKQSLEIISWNVLGNPNNDRVPFTGISKAFCCKCACMGRCTWDTVMAIFAWSVKSLVAGQHPAVDHQGKLLPAELLSLARKPLAIQGVLCQIRGDLPFF